MTNSLPLVLGGHSFISQLGNDAAPTPAEQIEIVAACLRNGITWFDTTYLPERVALGHALKVLRGRGKATIIAWNFFTEFDTDQGVGGAAYYQAHHIQQMLRELQTDVIDCLVVHPLDDAQRNVEQEALAQDWQAKGYVRQLGIWHPNAEEMANSAHARALSCYSFMVHPLNITTADAASAFAAARELGWQTLACSPYVRGWELERLVQRASKSEGVTIDVIRARLADAMLRFSLYQPAVDRLIVSMRKPEWVQRNAHSAQRGALSEAELLWLRQLAQSDT